MSCAETACSLTGTGTLCAISGEHTETGLSFPNTALQPQQFLTTDRELTSRHLDLSPQLSPINFRASSLLILPLPNDTYARQLTEMPLFPLSLSVAVGKAGPCRHGLCPAGHFKARSPGPCSQGANFHYYFNYYNFLQGWKVVHNSRLCHLYTCQMQSIKHK